MIKIVLLIFGLFFIGCELDDLKKERRASLLEAINHFENPAKMNKLLLVTDGEHKVGYLEKVDNDLTLQKWVTVGKWHGLAYIIINPPEVLYSKKAKYATLQLTYAGKHKRTSCYETYDAFIILPYKFKMGTAEKRHYYKGGVTRREKNAIIFEEE